MYERQNALVISYSPTERGYEGVCSISLYPHLVKLGFGMGARLSKSDPNKLLKGQDKMVRYVEFSLVEEFDRAEIESLIAGAMKLAKLHLDPNGERGYHQSGGTESARAPPDESSATGRHAPSASEPKQDYVKRIWRPKNMTTGCLNQTAFSVASSAIDLWTAYYTESSEG